MIFIHVAYAADLATSTASTVIDSSITTVKEVAGYALPVIFALAILIGITFWAFRKFKRLIGIGR